jgi:hypothetical protein
VTELQLNEPNIEPLTGDQLRGIRAAKRMKIQPRRESKFEQHAVELLEQVVVRHQSAGAGRE